MKTVLLASLLAVALSSGAAFASGARHTSHEAARQVQASHEFYSVYRNDAVNQPRLGGQFSTYSVDPSPVADQ